MEENAPSSTAWWRYLALAGVLVVAFGLSLLAGYQWTRQRAGSGSTTNLTDTTQQDLSPRPISLQVRSELVVAPIQPQLDTGILERWWQIIGVNSQALTLKELGGKTNYTPSRVEIIFKDITPLSAAERANLYKPVSGMPGTPIMAGLSTQAGSGSLTYTVWYAPEIVADGSSPEIIEQRLNLQLFEVLYEAVIGSTELTRDDYDAKRERVFPSSEDNPPGIVRLKASQSHNSSSATFWSSVVEAASHLIERVQQWRLVPQAYAQVCGGKFKCGNTSYNCICSSNGNTCSSSENGKPCGSGNTGTCNCGTTCVQHEGPLQSCSAAYQTCGIPSGSRCSQCEAQNTCGWTTGNPPPPPASCGNGTCGSGESCSNCPADCGECAVYSWAYITVTVYGENNELQAPSNRTKEQTSGGNRCKGYGFTSSTSGKDWSANGNCQSTWLLDMNKTDKSMKISGINSMYYGCEVRLNGTLITSNFSNGMCTVPTRTYNQYNDSLVVKLLKAPTQTKTPPDIRSFTIQGGDWNFCPSSPKKLTVEAWDPDNGGTFVNGKGIKRVQVYRRLSGCTANNCFTQVGENDESAPYEFTLPADTISTGNTYVFVVNVYDDEYTNPTAGPINRTSGNSLASSSEWTIDADGAKTVTPLCIPTCSFTESQTSINIGSSGNFSASSTNSQRTVTQYREGTSGDWKNFGSPATGSNPTVTSSFQCSTNNTHYGDMSGKSYQVICKAYQNSNATGLTCTGDPSGNPSCGDNDVTTVKCVAGTCSAPTVQGTSNDCSGTYKLAYVDYNPVDACSVYEIQKSTNSSFTNDVTVFEDDNADKNDYYTITSAAKLAKTIKHYVRIRCKTKTAGATCTMPSGWSEYKEVTACSTTPEPSPTPTPTPTPSCSLSLSNLSLNPGDAEDMTVAVSQTNGTVSKVDFSSNNTNRVLVSPTSDTTASFTTTATARGAANTSATITAIGFIGGVERCRTSATVSIVSTPVCSGGVVPPAANSTVCADDQIGLTTTTEWTRVNRSGSCSAPKCQWYCNSGTTWNSSEELCVGPSPTPIPTTEAKPTCGAPSDLSCSGSCHSNGKMVIDCTFSRDPRVTGFAVNHAGNANFNNSRDIDIEVDGKSEIVHYKSSSTFANQTRRFRVRNRVSDGSCDVGSNQYTNTVSEGPVDCSAPVCTDEFPDNAVAHPGDDTGLSADTRWQYSEEDTSRKCQFYCDDDYTWDADSGICTDTPEVPSCEAPTNLTSQMFCDGAIGAWTGVAGANQYKVQLKAVDANAIGFNVLDSKNSFHQAVASPEKDHYFRVRVRNLRPNLVGTCGTPGIWSDWMRIPGNAACATYSVDVNILNGSSCKEDDPPATGLSAILTVSGQSPRTIGNTATVTGLPASGPPYTATNIGIDKDSLTPATWQLSTACTGGLKLNPKASRASDTSKTLNFWVSQARDPWWQASDGDVYGATLKSVIPPDCAKDDSCKPHLAIRSSNSSDNGAVVSNEAVTKGAANQLGENKNYAAVGTAVGTGAGSKLELKQDYAYFEDLTRNYTKQTLPGSAMPTLTEDNQIYFAKTNGNLSPASTWTIDDNKSLVVFVDGNLTLSGANPVKVNDGGFVLFVVKGNISIAGNVTRLDGMYVANGTITIQNPNNEDNAKQFVGQGSFIGYTGITISRKLPGLENNTKPAAVFNYRPDIVFNTPPELRQSSYQWQEVAP